MRKQRPFIDKTFQNSSGLFTVSHALVLMKLNSANLNMTLFLYCHITQVLSSQKRAVKIKKISCRDDADIIVQLFAFGMGINKPDVRYVLHFTTLPKTSKLLSNKIGARRPRWTRC